jgi:hypothetical protein
MNPGSFTFNDTVYFAGGQRCDEPVNCTKGIDSATVEYYDANTKTWHYAAEKLPVAMSSLTCVSLDTAVICAHAPNYYVWQGPGTEWTTSAQSIYRIEFGFTAVAGRWGVFAGGEAQPRGKSSKEAGKRVDIYDSHTGKWSTAAASSSKKKLACAGADDLAVCGGGFDAAGHGGYMSTVDIFNMTSGECSCS